MRCHEVIKDLIPLGRLSTLLLKSIWQVGPAAPYPDQVIQSHSSTEPDSEPAKEWSILAVGKKFYKNLGYTEGYH